MNTFTPQVSVIVPLYNKAKYIFDTLQSIREQTVRDFEVIVVDDGSADGGDAIAAGFPDRRFRLIRQENAGPGAARNRGVREAAAPYLAFLDSDDCWRPGFLETHLRMLAEHPEAAASASATYDRTGGIPSPGQWKARGIPEGIYRVSAHTPARVFSAMASFMTPCTVVARTGEVKRWGGFHEQNCRFAEDSTLWAKMLLYTPVCFSLAPLTELNREASALSGNYRGARPVEPYLGDPELLRGVCPPALRGLLERFYALRACKTACMFSFWGEWRRGRELVRRFVSLRHWREPLFLPAMLGATPFGGWAGHLVRSVGVRRPAAPVPEPVPAKALGKVAGAGK